ncbi:unnamed protein product [Prunus armeniaca]
MECPLMPSVLARKLLISVAQPFINFLLLTSLITSLEHCQLTYSESRGHNFALNATFDDIEFNKYDGLIIPGGRAPEYLAVDASVLELVRKYSDS